MQHFAVHRYDGGEGNHAAARRGNAVERTGNGGFGHAGLYGHAHRGGVHLIADGGGAVEFGDFLLALDVAQCHHGTNEFDARRLAHLQGVQAGEIGHFDHDVVTIGGQVVHAPSQTAGFGEDRRQFALRSSAFDATLGRHVGHRGDRPRPDDIVDVDVVAHERLDTAFAVDHQRQPIAVLTGEIEK